MAFCAITPTRGDRSKFVEHLAWQISRMTIKPDSWYIIDHLPKSSSFDLTWRIKEGIKMAKADGFDEVFILEDDDFYAPDYFHSMFLGSYDFVGANQTTYYNLKNRTWQVMAHPKRASLFHTGFRISALHSFEWPADDYVFLDIPLWQYAKNAKFVPSSAIGIKHGIGKVGGAGHRMRMKNSDPQMKWLEQNVDAESFEFYQTLI